MADQFNPDPLLTGATTNPIDEFNALKTSGVFSPSRMATISILDQRGELEASIPLLLEKYRKEQKQEQARSIQDAQPAQPTKEDFENVPWADVIKMGVNNLPESGMQYLKDVFKTFEHPGQAIEETGKLVAGAIQKLVPGEQAQEQNIDLLIEFYKDRYGSIEGFKKAVATDPVGILADGATFITPGGAALRGVGTMSKLKFLQKAGRGIEKAGSFMEPTTAVGKTAMYAGKKAIAATPIIRKYRDPAKLYQSAVKFAGGLSSDEIKKLTNTALDEQVMPTAEGLDKVRTKINVISNEVSDLIDRQVNMGQKIPLDTILQHVAEIEKKARLGSEVDVDIAKIQKIVSNLVEPLIAEGKLELTPTHVQAIKQDLYEKLDAHYSSARKDPVTIKTKKALARGAKDGLQELIPEIKDLNARDGDLMALLEAIDKPVSRIERAQLASFSGPIKLGAGAAIGSAADSFLGIPGSGTAIGATIGAIATALDDPIVKARAAIILNKAYTVKGNLSKQAQNFIERNNIPVSSNVIKSLGLTMALPERAESEDEMVFGR